MSRREHTGPKILYLDIETAPALAYVWRIFKENVGIDQIVEAGRTICFAAKWDHRREIHFHSEWDDGVEGMLQAAWRLLDEADMIVHYNGTSFDIPTLQREFVVNELRPPMPAAQIDLLWTIRKKFRFISNKLDFVAQQLGIGAKLHHKGFTLWRDVMHGDAKAQATMARYNKQDVRLLPKLYQRILPWIQGHPNVALYMERSDKPKCRHCGSTEGVWRGVEHTSVLSYRRWNCNACGAWTRARLSEDVGKNRRQDILR